MSVLVSALLAAATPALAGEPPHPTLVVAIVVDQYSADVFSEYRAVYRDGLARLTSGVVFPRGYQSHAATETCPGHSTVLTGVRPGRNGIIANDWQNARLRRKAGDDATYAVYCAEDPGAADSDARRKTISPAQLLVPTLGDRLKAVNAASRVVAISGKDRSAVMLGGHHADLTLWWTNRGFVTYDDQASRIPRAISEKVNKTGVESFAHGVQQKLPPQCAGRSRQFQVSPQVSIGTLQSFGPNSRRWRTTPAFDAVTVDAALAAVSELQLGKRNVTDLLAISLAGTDYVGHYFGTAGAEMCSQQLALDATIGRLLTALDRTGVSYVVALTADHGGIDTTERNQQRGVPAQRLDPGLLPGKIGAELTAELGLGEPALLGDNEFTSDVWFSPAVPAEKYAALLDAAVRKYSSHPQVEKVFTRSELIAAAPPAGPADEWTLLERAKASFNPGRSGDLLVFLKPYVSIYSRVVNPETDYSASHGSAWEYDRRVPILFWWRGITGFEQPAAVETVDIAPTLASLMGLKIPPGEVDGRVLPIVVR